MWPFTKKKDAWVGVVTIYEEQYNYSHIVEIHGDNFKLVEHAVLSKVNEAIGTCNPYETNCTTKDEQTGGIFGDGMDVLEHYIPSNEHGMSAPNSTSLYKVIAETNHKYKIVVSAQMFLLNKDGQKNDTGVSISDE